jgi:2-polyprenyl-3-methyl-5-hydroxy-6-metoxy-1,4-benzoquinol methylase
LTDLVRLLARHRGDLGLAPCGPLRLKGLSEQVEVWSLRWRPSEGFSELMSGTPFVGRARELEVLEQVWGQAAAGSGGLVLVAGEPGIGKSRLVDEVVDHLVRPEGGLVLSGGCHDGDVVTNAPFAEAISAWVRSVDAERAASVLGPCAPVVARVAPAVREVLPETPEPFPVAPDAELLRLRDSVSQFLLRLSAEAPVMLVLEDLHWADDATVGLLRAVARTARGGPMLVVGTYRETDLDRRHPFAAAAGTLQREVEPVRVALSGLVVGEVNAMLEQLAGHEVPEAFASLLAGETQGNPFFLRETLLHLLEEGRIRRQGDQWTTSAPTAELGIPAGVRDVIGRRLSRLSDDANQLLVVAALFEVTFPLPIVAEVAGLSEQAALDALDEALEAQIVATAEDFDHYRFTHALFRHTLVDELNPSRRVRMHRAVADAIEGRLDDRSPAPDEAAALGRHLHLSTALPGAERAVPYALQLADDAARRYSRREELDAVLTALDCVDDGDQRAADLWRRAAHAALFAGLPAETIVAHATRAAELLAAGAGPDAAADFVGELVDHTETVTGIQLCWDLSELARRWLPPDRPDPAAALVPVDPEALREQVREKYRAVAITPEDTFHFHTGRPLAAYLCYEPGDVDPLPDRAVESFAGVGNPFSLRRLERGEQVLDVGSGAGFDSLVAATQVGSRGRVLGVDMTPEMVDKATATAEQLAFDNVEFIAGYAEELPVEDGWADVVISNGVINLCADKKAVFTELHRVRTRLRGTGAADPSASAAWHWRSCLSRCRGPRSDGRRRFHRRRWLQPPAVRRPST